MNYPERTCLALFHAYGRRRFGPTVRPVRIVSDLASGGVLAEPLDRPDRLHLLPPERFFRLGSANAIAADAILFPHDH